MTFNPIAQVTPIPSSDDAFRIITGPGWEFVSAIIASAALIITLVVLFIRQQRKQLSYELIERKPIISINEEIELRGRLDITFDGQPLLRPDLEIVTVRISNTGNVPVDDEDYSGPIKLSFGANAEVISVSVATEPRTFDAQAQVDPPQNNQVLILPVLLNKGQSIIVKALVRGATQLEVYAHIKGVELKFNEDHTKVGLSSGA